MTLTPTAYLGKTKTFKAAKESLPITMCVFLNSAFTSKKKLMRILMLIVSTSTLFQEALGSGHAIAKDAFLRSAVYESTRRKCYSHQTKDKFVGLGWSLKESMATAQSYIFKNKLSEDQFKPDLRLVEAYAEYFCETLRFPTHGEMPSLEVLGDRLLESPAQRVRHFRDFLRKQRQLYHQ